jgi:hypothetical protein
LEPTSTNLHLNLSIKAPSSLACLVSSLLPVLFHFHLITEFIHKNSSFRECHWVFDRCNVPTEVMAQAAD